MIISMTGFASVSRDRDEVAVGVTVRAVNHRYFDVQIRLPGSLAAAESTIRTLAQKKVARGRVEVTVSLHDRRRRAVDVAVNEPLIAAVSTALRGLREAGHLAGELTVSDVLRLPEALVVTEATRNEEVEALQLALVEEAVDAALDSLDEMRRREGTYLRADLESRRTGLGDSLMRLEQAAIDGRDRLATRLNERIKELSLDVAPESALLAQEIVRFVARSDVNEELVRFRAHLEHWKLLSDAPEPCGRKLDFLLQEMNREINTIGSKAEGTAVPELIVHAKAELERMREQVQNVE